MHKPFLKYSGNKLYSINEIKRCLKPGKCLVEPFIGSGAVFLNTDYQHYILADINKDLINLFVILKEYGQEFISYCKTLFTKETEPKDVYLEFRKEFNSITDVFRKSALFVYINRHAHGGSICRYGVGGKSTASYGNRVNVKLPEENMLHFYKKSKDAEFFVGDFTDTFSLLSGDEMVYCDPPYVPFKNKSAMYHTDLSNKVQEKLVEVVEKTKASSVAISNLDCEYTRHLYRNASYLHQFQSPRKVGKDSLVAELVAVYVTSN